MQIDTDSELFKELWKSGVLVTLARFFDDYDTPIGFAEDIFEANQNRMDYIFRNNVFEPNAVLEIIKKECLVLDEDGGYINVICDDGSLMFDEY